MKTLILSIFLLFPIIVQGQWVKYNAYNQSTLELTDIQFVNQNTGFAVGSFPGDTVFVKTTNGGVNWVRNFLNTDTTYIGYYNAIYFLNENTGFLCGGSRYIYKTTNGGFNWTGYPAPFRTMNSTYNDLYFVDVNTGFAVGRYGYVSKTTNGGISWDSIYATVDDANCVKFINSSTGFIADVTSHFFKTTNGGSNWLKIEVKDSANFAYGFQSLSFLDENTGYLTGYNSGFNLKVVLKTNNGGLNWHTVFRSNGHFYNIIFSNINTGYVFGGNTINDNAYKTTNGGNSWIALNLDTLNFRYYYSSHFFDAQNGIVGSNGGNVYKTTTGGVGIVNISYEIPSDFKIVKTYPNPFNAQVTIEFQVSEKIFFQDNNFIINIYDIKGSLVNQNNYVINSPGLYKVNLDFNNLHSGIYFLKINNNYQYTDVKKIILVK